MRRSTRFLLVTETPLQRLMGASLLVFKNKSDVPDAMSEDDIREVSLDKIPVFG